MEGRKQWLWEGGGGGGTLTHTASKRVELNLKVPNS